MSRRYHVPVHEYDCFDPARPICVGGRFVFHNECVGNRTGYRDSRLFDTLQNQISKNGDTGRRVIIKMGIEGGEWESLLTAPDELLASIPQLATARASTSPASNRFAISARHSGVAFTCDSVNRSTSPRAA